MATQFQVWKQAVLDLERAIAELDQVHASLKDCRLHDVQAGGYRRPSIKELVSDAQSLLEELRTAECDECSHAVARHGDRYGCEYERGDVEMPCRDGGTVMAAAGPCGCEWGLREAAAQSTAAGHIASARMSESDWIPDAAHINALPHALRSYIHDLESNADPAGNIATIWFQREQIGGLLRRLSEAKAELARLLLSRNP